MNQELIRISISLLFGSYGILCIGLAYFFIIKEYGVSIVFILISFLLIIPTIPLLKILTHFNKKNKKEYTKTYIITDRRIISKEFTGYGKLNPQIPIDLIRITENSNMIDLKKIGKFQIEEIVYGDTINFGLNLLDPESWLTFEKLSTIEVQEIVDLLLKLRPFVVNKEFCKSRETYNL